MENSELDENPTMQGDADTPPTENNGPALVVFFSNLGLAQIQTSNELFIDGTFKTCPAPFKQLVFVQAKQTGKRAVPVVFALMTNKVTFVTTCEYFRCR